MRYLSLGLCLLALAARADLPVDEEIAALRWKADYLNTLKETLIANQCVIEVDKNVVPLAAGALRSQGLVVAIGPAFAGNYLAYHMAPKPEFLNGVIESTLKKQGAGKNAVIVSTQLSFDSAGKFTGLVVSVAEPRLVPEDLWIYEKNGGKLAFPLPSSKTEVSFKSVQGKAVSVRCN